MMVVSMCDSLGNNRICEVTNMFDIDNDETDEIDLAVKAVIKWDNETWIAFVPDTGLTFEDYILKGN